MRPRTEHPEDELVGLARSGDAPAFETLVRSHDDRMRALAFRMLGSRTAMDDALQDAYLKAFRAIGSFRGDAAFSTWLHRIVATTCIDLARRQQQRQEDVLADESAPIGGGPGDPAGEAVTRRLDLWSALDRLDPAQRLALLLVDGEGLSYDEAGNVLEVPAGTVSSRWCTATGSGPTSAPTSRTRRRRRRMPTSISSRTTRWPATGRDGHPPAGSWRRLSSSSRSSPRGWC